MATTPRTPLTSRRNSSLHTNESLDGHQQPGIEQALHQLRQRVIRVRSSMDKLRELADVSPSELITGFELNQRTDNGKFEEERAKIRIANTEQARRMAETYLIGYHEIARRFEAQRRRMDTLESRTTRMETLFGEQIQLNQEIGDEAVQALSNFAETEKRQLAAWHEANARQEEMRAELNKAKGRADLLEDNNNELRGQMEQFTKEKCELARKLLDCQNECHSLRLAKDQMYHDMEVQGRILDNNKALLGELQQCEMQYKTALAEKERQLERMAVEREEMNRKMETERERQQQHWDMSRKEAERKMGEERARMANELMDQHRAELERHKAESADCQKMVNETLRKAAETHRKLEEERNKLFKEKSQLENNLKNYKRRFVAELNRELSTRCSQLGSELNSALVEVMDRISDSEEAAKSQNDIEVAQQQKAPGNGNSRVEQTQYRQQQKQLSDIRDGPSRLSSSASSISVFEPCENTRMPDKAKTVPMTDKRMTSMGKENNSRRNQAEGQPKKRPGISLSGFMAPPPSTGIGTKRKPTMMMIGPTPGMPSGNIGTSSKQPRGTGKWAPQPPAGGPSTSAARQAPSKFPAFQL